MADYRAKARATAARKNLSQDRFERQIGVESINYATNVIECRLDSPAGARGIAQLMPIHWSMVDPCDPDAALDYAAGLMRGHLDYWLSQGKDPETAYGLALASYNAGRQATIDGLAGKKAWWPFSETMTYLQKIMLIDEAQARTIMTGGAAVSTQVTYNPQEPAHPQDKSFDCSQDSLEWAMWSVGRKPTDGWMEQTMIQEGVMSASDGLMDASGAGLAAFVGRHYGEFGYYANNEPSVTFDGVAQEGTGAGAPGQHAYPLLIGGRKWGTGGHWSGVKGYDPTNDVILLANPADGWGGVSQTMTRKQFTDLGPFSMVRVLHPDLLKVFEAPAPPAPEPPAPPAITKAQVVERMKSLMALMESRHTSEMAEWKQLLEMAEKLEAK